MRKKFFSAFPWIPFKREQIYIIPTRVGGYFILATLSVLLVGSGYANNLVNLLAFFMLSLIFVGMLLTHAQLSGLQVTHVWVESRSADQAPRVKIQLSSADQKARYGLQFNRRLELHSVTAGPSAEIESFLNPRPRGLHELTEVRMSSNYPLGLFFTWRVCKVSAPYFSYPEPKGMPQLPASLRSALPGDDSFSEHRIYRPGDSSRHIDWKARARGRPLLVKQSENTAQDFVLLDIEMEELAHLDHEARLSQLALWVKTALEQKYSFRLDLADDPGEAGTGIAFAESAWQRLAEA